MQPHEHRRHLIRILQNAYSGEQAAALAYRGHWKSLRRTDERTGVRRIEEDEWEHRREVGLMLASLDASPRRAAELRTWIIGRVLGIACHLTGWFIPMYSAGRLEQGNAAEYDSAVMHANAIGRGDIAPALAHMAQVERDHEVFFRTMVTGHPWLPRMKRWFGWG